MSTYVQADRPLTVATPLGPDVLLLRGLVGHEALSQLFNFQLDLIAGNATKVPFEKLLGQKVSVGLGLPFRKTRYFGGICSRVTQGVRDATFTYYRMEVVPQLWFLTRRAQSRIFQHLSVPEILKKVLAGLDVSYELRGTYLPRDFCVQYRETDFNFASRLMEEEGIFYFFTHSADGHKLVLADTPPSHPDLPERSRVTFERSETGEREPDRITDWEKTQELRSGKVTLWDHSFELPHKHLEADRLIQDEAQAGTVAHKLKVGRNDKLEIYDYPGEYAQRFDGVDPAGGDRADDLKHIAEDNKRTVGIRMQEEAAAGLVIRGAGNCRYLVSGYKFTLEDHYDGDGPYVLTAVQHDARLAGDYRSDMGGEFSYANSFTAIPASIPFRPRRTTPKPVVQGTQTAVVVGPAGEEIFTDKYGRVKVQFHWDREGKNDADSSCWIRVGTPWSGRRWGTSFWPRIGQEVIVAFQEGDPDQPIVVGSVYNADQMPPYLGGGPDAKHPIDNKLSGIKSNTTPGGAGFNEFRFDDTKDKQQVFLHAEKNMDTRVKNDCMELILHDRHLIVGQDKKGDQHEQVQGDKHLHIVGNHAEKIEGDMQLLVGDTGGNQDIVIKKDRKELIGQDGHLHIAGDSKEKVDGDHDLTVGGDRKELVQGSNHVHVAGDRLEKVDGGESLTVGGDRKESVQGSDHRKVGGDRMESVVGGQSLKVGGDRKESVGGAYSLSVSSDRNESVNGTQSLSVTGSQYEKVGQSHALEAVQEIHIKSGMKLVIEAGMQLSLVGPGGFVDIGPAGVTIQGMMVKINSGGSAGSGSGASPKSPQSPQAPQDAQPPQDAKPPEDAAEAKPVDPAVADDAVTGQKSC